MLKCCFNTKTVGFIRDRSPGRPTVSRFGLAVRRWAGKRKDLGSIPFWLSFPIKKVVVCGHCPVTSTTSYSNIKMDLIAARLKAGIILVVTA